MEKFCECQWTDGVKILHAKAGLVSLDYDNIIKFNPERFTRVQYSNRHSYSLQERWEMLFHWDDVWEKKEVRKVWKNWPYRLLFQKCYEIITQTCGGEMARNWEYLLVKSKFARSNFVLPSPCKQSFLQRQTKKGEPARIYWVPILHESWKERTGRKLPAKDGKEDRWEFWEVDYSLPIPEESDSPEGLYKEDQSAEEVMERIRRKSKSM